MGVSTHRQGTKRYHPEEGRMTTEGQFSGKVSLVTGAGSGIGEACARELAARRSQVVVADLNLSAAEDVVEEIRGSGGDAAAVQADVADPALWIVWCSSQWSDTAGSTPQSITPALAANRTQLASTRWKAGTVSSPSTSMASFTACGTKSPPCSRQAGVPLSTWHLFSVQWALPRALPMSRRNMALWALPKMLLSNMRRRAFE